MSSLHADDDIPFEGEDRNHLAVDELPQPAMAVNTANAAIEAAARANVQARFAMALQRPRDPDLARERLMKECKRTSFAKVATWTIPNRGSGFSIRFAEAALRVWGNVGVDAIVLYDDAERRVLNLVVTDYEAPITYTRPLVIAKTMERNSIKKGQTVRNVRVGSDGQRVYVIEATDQDMAQKQGSEVSKAIRAEGLRLIPGDILDDCKRQLRETLTSEAARDPDAARKTILDGFASIHVSAAALKAYVGKELLQCSPAELEELRGIWVAIRDGQTTWQDILADKDDSAASDAPSKSRTEEMKQKLKDSTPPANGNAELQEAVKTYQKGTKPKPAAKQAEDPDLARKQALVAEITAERSKRKIPAEAYTEWLETVHGKRPERQSELSVDELQRVLLLAKDFLPPAARANAVTIGAICEAFERRNLLLEDALETALAITGRHIKELGELSEEEAQAVLADIVKPKPAR